MAEYTFKKGNYGIIKQGAEYTVIVIDSQDILCSNINTLMEAVQFIDYVSKDTENGNENDWSIKYQSGTRNKRNEVWFGKCPRCKRENEFTQYKNPDVVLEQIAKACEKGWGMNRSEWSMYKGMLGHFSSGEMFKAMSLREQGRIAKSLVSCTHCGLTIAVCCSCETKFVIEDYNPNKECIRCPECYDEQV